jgi:decaprenylphospho-beta-D-erythro-pentofuranosid-2-ulose 2-reductase
MTKLLILGATSPIARLLAMRFAQDGATLYLAARDADEAAKIASDIAVRAGTTAFSGAFDAADFATHADLVRRATDAMGGLDGVVLCFGTLGDEDAAQVEPAAAIATLHQNFTGAVSLMTIAARPLEEQKRGFMIVIGSVAGDRGRARNYVYGSAKAGLHAFSEGLRGRMARAGVHVMTVKLGTVDTRMTWGREGTLFSVAPEHAANAIYAAYQRKAEVVYVPWFWRPIMAIVRIIPERIFKRTSF